MPLEVLILALNLVAFAGLSDGTVTAVIPCQSVPNDLLEKILTLQEKGIVFADIIDRVRPHTVPSGYPYHRWNPGKLAVTNTSLLCYSGTSK